MAIEFTHEGLAERHDFAVGFALRVEVGAAFAAAHREGGEGVLEDLFESEELQDAEVHGRMEAEAALVGADCAVELNAVALIDLDFALVVNPGNLEENGAFRNDDAFENFVLFITGVSVEELAERFENFGHALNEFLFPRRGLLDILKHSLCIAVHVNLSLKVCNYTVIYSIVRKNSTSIPKKLEF